MKIGFIGLGRMGAGMARNLLQAGHEVTVYNRSRDKAEPLRRMAHAWPIPPADACLGVEAVLTMLADDSAVEHVVFGEKGIASALSKNAIHISCSTISTALARKLTSEHAARQQGYLSVPVFGRPEAAEAEEIAGGGRRQSGVDRALQSVVRRHRTPDLHRGRGTMASQCRKAVRKFHDREHAGSVRGGVCHAPKSRCRAALLP